MKWERGKKGSKETISPATGYTYVFKDGILRGMKTKGTWEQLGKYETLEEVDNAAQSYDLMIAEQMTNNLKDITKALELSERTAILRDSFNQLMTINGLKQLYKIYSDLRGNGFKHEYLISQMENLRSDVRGNISWAFDNYYKARFKVRGR